MICEHCQKENRSIAKFCRWCGQPLIQTNVLDRLAGLEEVKKQLKTVVDTYTYLRSRKTVAQNMTLMTRLLEPTPQGLPLEIYAFANTTEWEDFEGIQADILDHLIAAMSEFGLELYQYGAGFKA